MSNDLTCAQSAALYEIATYESEEAMTRNVRGYSGQTGIGGGSECLVFGPCVRDYQSLSFFLHYGELLLLLISGEKAHGIITTDDGKVPRSLVRAEHMELLHSKEKYEGVSRTLPPRVGGRVGQRVEKG